MPLVGSFIMPHGALTLTKYDPTIPPQAHKLHDACMAAAKEINDLKPDIIFLTTPHGVSLTNDYVIYGNHKAAGTAEWAGQWQDYKCEVKIAHEKSANLNNYLSSLFPPQDIRFELVTSFAPSENIPLRWGEVIPIWFIQQQRDKEREDPECKRLEKAADMVPELFQIGKNLNDYFAEMTERVVVVISGDLAHTHSHQYKDHPTPFGIKEYSETMDATLEKWATTLDVSLLHVEATKYLDTAVCGYTGFVTLSGILANSRTKWDSKVIAREHPTYYGMMIASFHPTPLVPVPPTWSRAKKVVEEEYPVIG